MPISFLQKVRLDNFKEHYNSIVSNLSIKNKELEKVLSKVLEARISLNHINDKFRQEVRALEVVRSFIDSVEHDQNTKEQRLEKRERLLAKRESSLDVLEQELIGKKIQRESVADIYVKEKKIEVEGLVALISKRMETVSDKKIELENITANINGINEMREGSKKEMFLLEQRIEILVEEERGSQRNITEIKKELILLDEEVIRAKERILTPDKMLKERELVVGRKERNLQILILRWGKFFKEHFPNQELKL